MACFHPLRAWRTYGGEIVLGREPPDASPLPLPCGGCLGCREDNAKSWALRCHLELLEHRHAVFTTLTYATAPPTLNKRDLQLWLKRLRKATARKLRFFAAGEYGEQNGRPHYHAILYGPSAADAATIEDTWGKGHCRTVNVTPAAIAYTAGYCAKKLSDPFDAAEDRIDYETGELYRWQPPFIQMSRRPGIGGEARKWTESWRSHAVHNRQTIKVPRFLHNAWKATATDEQIEQLAYEKHKLALERDNSKERLEAAEQIHIAKQKQKAERRKL